MPAQACPSLPVGALFPVLALQDHTGNPVSGNPASSVIVFFRGHWCDHCCAQLIALADDIDAFRSLGVRMIAISADDSSGTMAMHNLVGDAIQVLMDANGRLIESLGLLEFDDDSQKVVARPSVYIVDASGIVRYRYIGRTIQDRPKPALLLLGAESSTIAR